MPGRLKTAEHTLMLGLYSEQLNMGADETELNTGTSPERLKPSHHALYVQTAVSQSV